MTQRREGGTVGRRERIHQQGLCIFFDSFPGNVNVRKGEGLQTLNSLKWKLPSPPKIEICSSANRACGGNGLNMAVTWKSVKNMFPSFVILQVEMGGVSKCTFSERFQSEGVKERVEGFTYQFPTSR